MLENDIVIEFEEEPHEFDIERDKDEVTMILAVGLIDGFIYSLMPNHFHFMEWCK